MRAVGSLVRLGKSEFRTQNSEGGTGRALRFARAKTVVVPLGVLAALAMTRAVAGVQPESAATLDVVVAGRDGKVPASMTPADFTLKVGGRVQQIRSVEKITPADDKGRYVLLIVDEATLQALEPIAREAIARLLTSLSPKDQVEYFSTRQNGTHTEATTTRETITAAVEKMVTGPGVLWVCQRDMMELIASFARDLPRGRSTSIAVLSRGHPEEPSTPGGTTTPCAPSRDDLRRLEEALGMAQVNLHLFTVGEGTRSWGFDNIAANTGGTSSLLSWASGEALAREIQSVAPFYRITFAWDAPADRAQRVELKANDKSLTLRTSSVLKLK